MRNTGTGFVVLSHHSLLMFVVLAYRPTWKKVFIMFVSMLMLCFCYLALLF